MKKKHVDVDKSTQAYSRAANLHQPEAIVAYAIGVYQGLIAPLHDRVLNYDPYPADKIHVIDQKINTKVWMYLKNSAIMDWISPFLVSQTKQAEHLGIWEISEIVKYAMERRKTGEKLVIPFMQTVRCSNVMCTFACSSFDNNSVREMCVLCSRCLKQTYCSNRCE